MGVIDKVKKAVGIKPGPHSEVLARLEESSKKRQDAYQELLVAEQARATAAGQLADADVSGKADEGKRLELDVAMADAAIRRVRAKLTVLEREHRANHGAELESRLVKCQADHEAAQTEARTHAARANELRRQLNDAENARGKAEAAASSALDDVQKLRELKIQRVAIWSGAAAECRAFLKSPLNPMTVNATGKILARLDEATTEMQNAHLGERATHRTTRTGSLVMIYDRQEGEYFELVPMSEVDEGGVETKYQVASAMYDWPSIRRGVEIMLNNGLTPEQRTAEANAAPPDPPTNIWSSESYASVDSQPATFTGAM